MNASTGKFIILIGSIIVLIGIIILYKDQIPGIRHMGRLPGDIVIHRKNFSIYFPVVTGIVISIILSLILYIIRKFR
jgi:hypothetical protein